MSVECQESTRVDNDLKFPASAQERVAFLENVLWDNDGALNVNVLDLLSLSPSVPEGFRQDFVADMLDVIDQMIASAADHREIAKRLVYEFGSDFGKEQEEEGIEPPHTQEDRARKRGTNAISDLQIPEAERDEWKRFMHECGIPMNSNDGIEAPAKAKELWKSFRATRSVEVRNMLAVHYSYLVHTHAARLSRNLPPQILYDDLCSAAFDGLIEAIEGYDPRRKAKFETYCQHRISGAVMDWLRCLDPRKMGFGPVPTEAELTKRLDTNLERYEYLSRVSQLGRKIEDRGNKDSRHGRVTRDACSQNSGVCVSRQMLSEYITKGLSREERLVLVLYYFEGMTMAEIGCVLDLSESRVSQIHKEILQRMRHRFSVGSGNEQAKRAG